MGFFRDLKIPCLTEEDGEALDSPIGLEEDKRCQPWQTRRLLGQIACLQRYIKK